MRRHTSKVSDFIRGFIRELPDDLHTKSRTFQIELSKVEFIVENDFKELEAIFNTKISDEDKKSGHKIRIRRNDRYALLRRAIKRL